MAYTPQMGYWNEMPSGDYSQGPSGYWSPGTGFDFSGRPDPAASPFFNQQGQHTGWTTQNGTPGSFSTWDYGPDGGLIQGGGEQIPSRNSMTNFMGVAVPAAMAAGLAYYAPAALAASGGTAAPAGASWGLTGGAFGTGGAATAADVAAALGTTGAAGAGAAGPWSIADVAGAGGGVPSAAGGAGAAATGGAGPWSIADVAGVGGGPAAASGGGMQLPTTLGGWGSAISNWLPILGAAGGALQGSQNQTTTQQTQLPPWLQALGPQLTNASINAANQPFQNYNGQRIEPFNPNQQAAFDMVRNRATQGSPVERAGQDAVTRGATGNANPMFGLDNPYLNKQIDNTIGDINRNFNKTVVPQLDAMNTRANTGFGTSSAMDEMRGEAYRNLNETTARTANDMRYKDYYTQAQLGEGMAGRQLQAAGLAPNMGALDYRNADALLGVGNQQQQLGQQGQDFNYNEFLRQLQYPDQQLQRLGYPFGFNQGNTQTTTTPGVGGWAGGISGLLGGIGMSNMMNQRSAVSGPATMTPPPRTEVSYGGWPNPYDLTAWGQ